MVPVRKDPEALPACHDKVDIHPKGFIRFALELFELLKRLATNVTQKLLIFWRSEFRDPMVLTSRNRRPEAPVRSEKWGEFNPIYIEAISARERITKPNPMKVQM